MELFKTVPAYSIMAIYLFSQIMKFTYSETLHNEYIERIHQMSYSSLSDRMCRSLVFYLNDYMELFKTVPAYSWLFI